MITISQEAQVVGSNLILQLPGVLEGIYQVIIVLQARPSGKRRRAGFSKARFNMATDFNEPLEDFKEYI